jgi:hypothetical protein
VRLTHVLPLLALLLAPAGLLAAPPAVTRTPNQQQAAGVVSVPQNTAADLTADVPKGGSVIWQVLPAPEWTAPTQAAGRLIFTGVPGRTYSVACIVLTLADGPDGKPTVKTDTSNLTVQFQGVSPPGPGPDPVPPGPQPIPPALLGAVQTAYQSEPVATRAADAAALAGVFRSGVRLAADPTVTTRKQLAAATHAAGDAAISTRLNGVRRAVGDYLNAAVGRTDVALDPALRAAYSRAYSDAAAALDTLR